MLYDFGGGFTPGQTYAAKYQLDLEGEYKIAKNVAVAIGGRNIGDTYSQASIDDISYFGNLPYNFLSPVGFNGAYYYARLTYSF